MESSFTEERQNKKLIQISQEEIDIINDIRELNFGRINIIVQDGVVVSKEITKVFRNNNRNGRNRIRNNNILNNKSDRRKSDDGNYRNGRITNDYD